MEGLKIGLLWLGGYAIVAAFPCRVRGHVGAHHAAGSTFRCKQVFQLATIRLIFRLAGRFPAGKISGNRLRGAIREKERDLNYGN
jgi:hypothetical protein